MDCKIFIIYRKWGGERLDKRMKDDVKWYLNKTLQRRTTFEVITTYAGLHAVWSHLIAHKLYNKTLRFGENDFTSISLLQELKFILEQNRKTSIY